MKPSSVRRRVFGALRVFAYAQVACVIVAALASRAVYADFMEGALRTGRELEGFEDVLGSTKTVVFNGAAMNISTVFSDESPTAVLDRFQALCEAHPQALVRALSDAPAALREKAERRITDRALRLGILRKEVDGEGALACFTSEQPLSIAEVPARLRAFAASKDLGEFGHLRYVYVHRTEKGTHVRTVWTDGHLALGRMFPPSGDAEGFDSSVVPRPPEAKRLLSATSAQVPYALHVYESVRTKPELRAFYDGEMTARGWKAASPETHGTVLYMQQGVMVYVAMTTREGRTVVSTIETGRPDTPTIAEGHVDTVARAETPSAVPALPGPAERGAAPGPDTP